MTFESRIATLWRSSALRFVLVGSSNLVVSASVFWSVVMLPFSMVGKAAFAQLCCYLIGVAWSFYWNRRFTFRTQGALWVHAYRFLALQVALLCASTAGMGLLADFARYPLLPTWVAVQVVCAVVNYVLCKHWVFR